jgi:sugar lactone lactonase YvrE
MQIYTNLTNDETASVTLQLSAQEFAMIRKYMHTPEKFHNVKFPNGVYLNPRGSGWYRLETSNNFLVAKKLETTLVLIRKIDRWIHGSDDKTVQPPRPRGIQFAAKAR